MPRWTLDDLDRLGFDNLNLFVFHVVQHVIAREINKERRADSVCRYIFFCRLDNKDLNVHSDW